AAWHDTAALVLLAGLAGPRPLAGQEGAAAPAPAAPAAPAAGAPDRPAPAAAPAPRPAPPTPAPAAVAPVPAAQAQGALTDAEVDSLLARASGRFRVLASPRGDGILLLPNYGAPGVAVVEIVDGDVTVDGAAVPRGGLAERLGEDAPLVVSLSYVPPDVLQDRLEARESRDEDDFDVPDVPEPPDVDSDFDIDIDVDEDGDLVRFGGDVTVAAGEVIGGDVVAMGGNVDVAGTVLGDVVCMGGRLTLRDTAIVHGDAVAVGGTLEKAPGARVLGQQQIVGVSVPFVAPFGAGHAHGGFGWVGGLFFTILSVGLFLLLGSIFQLFLPRHLDRVETNVRSSPVKAGLVGFLAQVLFIPAFLLGLILLVVTIIGIPLALVWAVAFIPLGFLAAIFGFTAVARLIGTLLASRAERGLTSPYVAIFVGLAGLFAPMLLSNLFDMGGGLLDLLSVVFFILGTLALYLAATIGFGAVLLTRFGTRTSWSGGPPAGERAPQPPPPYEPEPAGSRTGGAYAARREPLPPEPPGRPRLGAGEGGPA
ncbi:MAG TPA: polymer-forming cytoskeletal protein, partial [Gemmatimonadota bacterium]